MSGHKEMGIGGRENLIKRYARRYNLTYNFNPQEEGGLVRAQDGTPIRQVRGPKWRAENNTPGQTKSDASRLYTAENLSLGKPDTGGELELNIFNKRGELEPVMNDDHPVHQALRAHNQQMTEQHSPETNGNGYYFIEEEDAFDHGLEQHEKAIGYSQEFLRAQIELNFANGHDDEKRRRKMVRGMRKIVRICELNDTLVTPLSVLPHRKVEQPDTNPHPYVQRIVYEFMKKERAHHFVGTSFQTHTEMLDLESALKATNNYQLLVPILYAGTLAGPFMAGEQEVDMKELFATVPDIHSDPLKQSTYDRLDQGSHKSYRYFTRFMGSPSGGVMREPLPETADEFWEKAEAMLRTQESPTVARIGGHHTDFRIRPDLGPHGTIELAALDTAGARVQNLVALQEFSRTLGWKLQLLEKTGKAQEVLSSPTYQPLFGSGATKEAFETVHWNTIAVAKEGSNARITGMDGIEYTVSDLWEMMVQFVQEPIPGVESYQGVPDKVVDVLTNTYQDPTTLFDTYKDENGITSVEGYYTTGVGTLADWSIQRALELRQQGIGEREAIDNVTRNAGESFHRHAKDIKTDDINAMYN